MRLRRPGAPEEESCWSPSLGLPLRVRRASPAGKMEPVYWVEAVDRRPASAALFRAEPTLVELDADAELQPD